MNTVAPESIAHFLDGLRWRMWREVLIARLTWGVWAAGALLCAIGCVHLALAAQDWRWASFASASVIALGLVFGLLHHAPSRKLAAAEADRRFQANDLFSAAWTVSNSAVGQRPGAAEMVLSQAAVLAERLSSAPTRSGARTWRFRTAAVVPLLVGGALLALAGAPGSHLAGNSDAHEPGTAAKAASLATVIAAIDNDRARQPDARPATGMTPNSAANSYNITGPTAAPARGAPQGTEKTPSERAAEAETAAGERAFRGTGPTVGEAPISGGREAGDAERGLSAETARSTLPAADRNREVTLQRRAGGAAPGADEIEPPRALPEPASAAPGSDAAGDTMPWSPNWPTALRHYVARVLEPPSAAR